MLELVPDPDERPVPPPRLPGSVVVRASADDLLDAAAGDLFTQAVACVRRFGDFHLAVATGPTLDRLYTRLMCDPTCRGLPWKRTHLWLVEEADVPGGDPRSRLSAIRDALVEHSDIPDEQVHPIGTGPAAAAEYQACLRETLAWRERGHDRLDCVMLELEEGGEVAGLRCGAGDADDLVTMLPTRPPVVSLTPAMLNAARFIGVLAVGDAAASGVRAMRRGAPASRLRPLAGELRWYLDHAACAAD